MSTMSPREPWVTTSSTSFPRAVRARQRDERPPQIVLPPPAHADAIAVFVEALERVVNAPVRAFARRNDQIVYTRRATHHPLPTAQLPCAEDGGERRVHRHFARALRLDRLHLLLLHAVRSR